MEKLQLAERDYTRQNAECKAHFKAALATKNGSLGPILAKVLENQAKYCNVFAESCGKAQEDIQITNVDEFKSTISVTRTATKTVNAEAQHIIRDDIDAEETLIVDDVEDRTVNKTPALSPTGEPSEAKQKAPVPPNPVQSMGKPLEMADQLQENKDNGQDESKEQKDNEEFPVAENLPRKITNGSAGSFDYQAAAMRDPPPPPPVPGSRATQDEDANISTSGPPPLPPSSGSPSLKATLGPGDDAPLPMPPAIPQINIGNGNGVAEVDDPLGSQHFPADEPPPLPSEKQSVVED
mmetsp:Transcript_19709/g.27741  ORF Transcript_19709/g.27741 Transcript_19709/m.27741 type:complete len:295 (-) Transcript_19709:133-1017(-)